MAKDLCPEAGDRDGERKRNAPESVLYYSGKFQDVFSFLLDSVISNKNNGFCLSEFLHGLNKLTYRKSCLWILPGRGRLIKKSIHDGT